MKRPSSSKRASPNWFLPCWGWYDSEWLHHCSRAVSQEKLACQSGESVISGGSCSGNARTSCSATISAPLDSKKETKPFLIQARKPFTFHPTMRIGSFTAFISTNPPSYHLKTKFKKTGREVLKKRRTLSRTNVESTAMPSGTD